MEIRGQFIRFFLSPQGSRALKGLVPAKRSFESLVLEEDSLGLLVWPPGKKARLAAQTVPVMLLRWDYVAAMTFAYQADAKVAPRPIGFSSATR